MVELILRAVSKTFSAVSEARPVLCDIDLLIPKGEVVAIRGDNGCGKTTLLNMIAGLEIPTAGTIAFDGLHHQQLRIGYVQQDYSSSLLPWYNVVDNVAIPLRLRGIGGAVSRNRAQEFLAALGFRSLPPHAFPHELSGGQKQKVAVARALIHDPHLLLLDEPFANLDAHTGRDLEHVLSRTHEDKHPTILYVSHELDRCIMLADRVLTIHGLPARVVSDFKVTLPRPRCRDVMFSSQYAQMRAQVLAQEETLYGKPT